MTSQRHATVSHGASAHAFASEAPTDVQALGNAVGAFALAIEGFRTAYARRYSVAVNDSLVLSTLAQEKGAMRPSEIGKRLAITAGTLTTMLDRLEDAGFLKRSRDPEDRRGVRVQVTATGRDALEASRHDIEETIAAAVSPADQVRLADCLAELTTALTSTTERIRESDAVAAESR